MYVDLSFAQQEADKDKEQKRRGGKERKHQKHSMHHNASINLLQIKLN